MKMNITVDEEGEKDEREGSLWTERMKEEQKSRYEEEDERDEEEKFQEYSNMEEKKSEIETKEVHNEDSRNEKEEEQKSEIDWEERRIRTAESLGGRLRVEPLK